MPPAVAMVKREQPDLRVSLEIETSPVLIERLEQGKLDILVARLFAEHDKSQLRYERWPRNRCARWCAPAIRCSA
jgi:DNA-binding transcriptional LysR family regulator